jgi:DNA replication initiation complex subunit (GINS family)
VEKMKSSDKEEKSTITIRGINKKIYNRLATLSREMDKTIGELVNEAMSMFVTMTGMIEGVDKNIMVIMGIESLRVSKEELENIDKKVLLMNIDELILEKGITTEIFEGKIHKILNVSRLRIEGNVNKLLVYSKCVNVKDIEFGKN